MPRLMNYPDDLADDASRSIMTTLADAEQRKKEKMT
jgi:hypothetical protein